MSITMIAAPDDAGRRLDRILRKTLPDLPLSRIHRLLRKGQIMLDGIPVQGAIRVKAGSVITIPEGATPLKETSRNLGKNSLPPRSSHTPEDFSLIPYILWEGEGLLIVNKPAGLVVHGPESLETRVHAYLADRLLPSLSFRPGPLHRLDRQTSGLIVFSKNLEGARYFSTLIREGQVKKHYLALVEGRLDTPMVWEDALIRDKHTHKTFIAGRDLPGSQSADTRIIPLAVSTAYSLIRAEIGTGRTHQIRAQAAFHGYPLAGDKKYGGTLGYTRVPQDRGFLLHAYTLEFPAHHTENKGTDFPLRLQAPLPEPFSRRIQEIFGNPLPLLPGYGHGNWGDPLS